jgi:hypothetical protein
MHMYDREHFTEQRILCSNHQYSVGNVPAVALLKQSALGVVYRIGMRYSSVLCAQKGG